MYCYINMRHALADLVPVPGHPTAFLARDAPPVDQLPPIKQRTVVVDAPEGTPEYRWPWLDGRFVYVARGRENVARHMREMGGVGEPAPPPPPPAPAPDASAKQGEPAPTPVTSASSSAAAAAADASHPSPPPSPSSAGRPKRKLMPHAVVVEGERVGAWDTMRRIEERVEKQEADKALPGKREERMLRRAMGFEDDRCVLSPALSRTQPIQGVGADLVLCVARAQLRDPDLALGRLLVVAAAPARPPRAHLLARAQEPRAPAGDLDRRHCARHGRHGRDPARRRQRLQARRPHVGQPRERAAAARGAQEAQGRRWGGGRGEADPFGGSQPPVLGGGGGGGPGFPPLPPMPPPAGAPRTTTEGEGEQAASAGGQGAPGAPRKAPPPHEPAKVYYTACTVS